MVSANIDIFMIFETKLVKTFPRVQFSFQVFYKPYWFERNRNDGGISLYVKEGISSRLIERKFRNDIEYLIR